MAVMLTFWTVICKSRTGCQHRTDSETSLVKMGAIIT